MTPTKTDEFNARETAKLLGCSRSYLYLMMADGRLQSIKKPSAAKQPPLYFSRKQVLTLAENIQGMSMTDEAVEAILSDDIADIERLRREAGAGEG